MLYNDLTVFFADESGFYKVVYLVCCSQENLGKKLKLLRKCEL